MAGMADASDVGRDERAVAAMRAVMVRIGSSMSQTRASAPCMTGTM
jgi:hypothetical protein